MLATKEAETERNAFAADILADFLLILPNTDFDCEILEREQLVFF